MIVVIGATSFIGVHTVTELVNHGHEVLVTGRGDRFKNHYDKIGVKYVNLDITNESDFDKLPKSGVDGVILLAGLLPANAPVNLDEEENAADYFKVNVIGTINCLEYCRKNGIKRLISTSSYADVRDSWSAEKRISEDEPRGFSFKGDHAVYVISKNAANDVLEYYNQQHGMKNAWFRFPTVYGVGPHGSLYINGEYKKSGFQIFMEKAMNGEPITIFGNPNMVRDVAYVKDVARAFRMAIISPKTYGMYNMTAGKGVSLQEQAEVLRDVFAPSDGKKSEILYKPEVPNNTPSYLFSIEKANKDFGFVPKFRSFHEMMDDFKKDLDQHLYQELFKY